MKSADVVRPDLAELEAVRGRLFAIAKARWGLALLCSYLAILTVPAFVLGVSDSPRWLAPVFAAAFAIAARLLHWWSDTVRGDAETLHRQNEYARGIGLAVDAATVATIKARHGFPRKMRQAPKNDAGEYYELEDEPSPRFLALMLRESAWWTQQLATKAGNVIFRTTVIIGGGSIVWVAITIPNEPISSTSFMLYALAVCAIVSLDLFSLGVRYQALSSSAEEAFSRLRALEFEENERKVIVAAGNYQIARQAGPLIPGWIKWWYRDKLQRIWNETLSRQVTSGTRTD